jgi:hypothetical protein
MSEPVEDIVAQHTRTLRDLDVVVRALQAQLGRVNDRLTEIERASGQRNAATGRQALFVQTAASLIGSPKLTPVNAEGVQGNPK